MKEKEKRKEKRPAALPTGGRLVGTLAGSTVPYPRLYCLYHGCRVPVALQGRDYQIVNY